MEQDARHKERFPGLTFEQQFLLREVAPNIYRSSYHLEGFPFAQQLDTYVVVEPGKRAMFVDVGWDLLCGTEFIDETIRQFGLSWEQVEIFLTHFHWDHCGNVSYLLSKGAKRLYHGPFPDLDIQRITEEHFREAGPYRELDESAVHQLDDQCSRMDFDEYDHEEVEVGEGYAIDIAGYHFEVFETPGHTLEHVCLADKAKGVVFAGDHILEVAPIVNQPVIGWHTLTRCIASLRKMQALDASLILMCHAEPIMGKQACWDALEKMLVLNMEQCLAVESCLATLGEPATVAEVCEASMAGRPKGFWDCSASSRMTKTLRRCGQLEFLCDLGRVHHEIDETGLIRYSIAR